MRSEKQHGDVGHKTLAAAELRQARGGQPSYKRQPHEHCSPPSIIQLGSGRWAAAMLKQAEVGTNVPKGFGLLLSCRSAHKACSCSVNSTKPMPRDLPAPPASPLGSSRSNLTCLTWGRALLARSLTCITCGWHQPEFVHSSLNCLTLGCAMLAHSFLWNFQGESTCTSSRLSCSMWGQALLAHSLRCSAWAHGRSHQRALVQAASSRDDSLTKREVWPLFTAAMECRGAHLHAASIT